MLGIEVVARRQPLTKKPVYELAVSNFFGRWMRRRLWGAFTLPVLWFVVILYWFEGPGQEPDPYTRVHEFTHVAQDERNVCFLVTWMKYGLEWLRHNYWGNKYELEAYAVEGAAKRDRLPEWAR